MPSKTTAAPGIGRTIDPMIVAAKIASRRHDSLSIPEGTGINKITPAMLSITAQRSILLRNPNSSGVGSSFGCSGGSDDGCSTRSSFYWGDTTTLGYYSDTRLLLKSFRSMNPTGEAALVSIWRTERRIEVF